jgi:hypothetical protein
MGIRRPPNDGRELISMEFVVIMEEFDGLRLQWHRQVIVDRVWTHRQWAWNDEWGTKCTESIEP